MGVLVESVLVAVFCMVTVFAVLIALWALIRVFSGLLGAAEKSRTNADERTGGGAG